MIGDIKVTMRQIMASFVCLAFPGILLAQETQRTPATLVGHVTQTNERWELVVAELESGQCVREGEWLEVCREEQVVSAFEVERVSDRVFSGTPKRGTLGEIRTGDAVFRPAPVAPAAPASGGGPAPAGGAGPDPVVVIGSPRNGDTIQEGVLHLSGCVVRSTPIRKIEVLVNGKAVEVRGIGGVALLEGTEGSSSTEKVPFDAQVSLDIGECRIEVVVTDAAGHVGRETVSVFRKSVTPSSLPRIWCVAIGVNDYADSALRKLGYAEADAHSLADFCAGPHVGADPARVTTLLSKDVTHAKTIMALKNTFKQAFEEDLVLVYLALHGIPDPTGGDELYFAMQDTDPTNLEGTALPQSQLLSLLHQCRAHRILLIVDACHSGAVGQDRDVATRGADPRTAALLARIAESTKTTAIFSAAAANEVSYEGPEWGGGHGAFTHVLLGGLTGEADENNDGYVTLREIQRYSAEQCHQVTKGRQHPELKGVYDNDLPLSRTR